MGYLVIIRYKNGLDKVFETTSSECPLRFPSPLSEVESVPNPPPPNLPPSVYYQPTYTTNSRTVLAPVPTIQQWEGHYINVYEVLDITIEGEDD